MLGCSPPAFPASTVLLLLHLVGIDLVVQLNGVGLKAIIIHLLLHSLITQVLERGKCFSWQKMQSHSYLRMMELSRIWRAFLIRQQICWSYDHISLEEALIDPVVWVARRWNISIQFKLQKCLICRFRITDHVSVWLWRFISLLLSSRNSSSLDVWLDHLWAYEYLYDLLVTRLPGKCHAFIFARKGCSFTWDHDEAEDAFVWLWTAWVECKFLNWTHGNGCPLRVWELNFYFDSRRPLWSLSLLFFFIFNVVSKLVHVTMFGKWKISKISS